MSTWQEMLSLEDPVQGKSEDYATANIETQRVCEAVSQIAAEFTRLKGSGSIEEMQGQAGDQLRTIIEVVDGSLSDLPRVLTEVNEIFSHHNIELRRLEAEAASALARAKTNWATKQNSETQRGNAEMYLSGIQASITNIHWNPSEDPAMDQPALNSLYAQEQAQYSTISMHNADVAVADAELSVSAADHAVIVEEEIVLRQTTVNGLGGIDLGDLDDPNAVMGFLGAVGGGIVDFGGFIYGIGESVVQSIDALVDGRFMDALWHLSDALGDVLTILAVVGLVVAIVASGGAVIALAAIALGALKLAMDVTLAFSQSPHPETGETMSWKAVAVDSAILVFNIATLGIAGGVGGAFDDAARVAAGGADDAGRVAQLVGWSATNVPKIPVNASGARVWFSGFRAVDEGVFTASMTALDVTMKGNPVTDPFAPVPISGGVFDGIATILHEEAFGGGASPVTVDIEGWDAALINMVSMPAPPVVADIHATSAQLWSPPADFISMNPNTPNFELVEVGP